MAQPVYATEAEYNASPYGRAAAPSDIADRLAIASGEIDRLLAAAIYDVDDNEKPTDADQAEAIREATIAQTSHDIDPAAGVPSGALPAGVTSAQIGSASITRATASPEIMIGGIAYSPWAVGILHTAGLIPGQVVMA